MSTDGYDSAPIILNPWPDWIGGPDGSWARHWTFEFEMPVADAVLSSAKLDQPRLHIELARGATPKELRLVATTRANAWSDEVFFFEFYTLFQRLEDLFGPIRTIEGQARDLWRPFR
ncbi:hypothetical protein [Nannocystis bainbridge]|uniref:Uncharacterized protein n=1 Tax=Nannocystis bainbridge TaxID=2995303 RepID=A0ABT5ECR3_9BACT|nr:hypothetical protein [Nannocystis bainbridge]MDC0723642.1 hypothetical protein [Nannocystis bainbridge]